MILSETKAGVYKVDGILLNVRLRRRLCALGIVNRSEMTVLRARRGCPAVVSALGAKYALGRSIADGILLSPKERDT